MFFVIQTFINSLLARESRKHTDILRGFNDVVSITPFFFSQLIWNAYDISIFSSSNHLEHHNVILYLNFPSEHLQFTWVNLFHLCLPLTSPHLTSPVALSLASSRSPPMWLTPTSGRLILSANLLTPSRAQTSLNPCKNMSFISGSNATGTECCCSF